MKSEIAPFTDQLLSLSLMLTGKRGNAHGSAAGGTRMCALKLLGSLLANENGNIFKTGTKEEDEEAKLKLACIEKTLEDLARADPVKEIRELAATLKRLVFLK